MGKKKNRDEQPPAPPGGSTLADLMAAGDNRSARQLARRMLADEGAGPELKAAALDALARTGFDRGALVAGLFALAVAVVVIALLFL